MFKQRPNRRKQNISTLSADPDSLSSSSQLPKRRWMQPSSSDEFGICAATDGGGVGGGDAFVVDNDDLEDDDLRFKGFSYTYNTPGDAKSLLDYFACPKCPAIFDSRVGLTNHSKLHGGQLPLQCEHCDFSCTNQKTLRFHRRAHGVMPRRGRPTPPRSTAADALRKKHRLTAEPPPPPPIGGENADKNVDRRGGDDGVRAKNNIKKHGEEVPLEEEENFIIINAKKSCGEEAYSAGGGDSVKFGPPPLLARATINRAGFEEEDDEEEANFDHQQQPLPSTSKASRRPSSTTNSARAASRTSKQQKGDGGNVQCAMCPFSTPSRVRLQSHMDGHYRTTGFVCSVCEYKHESMGWLHLHCTSLHLRKEGVPFQWPPAYVKEAAGWDKGIISSTTTTIT
uniref:C2H2-type domain-containing protein n=1 Tax=Globodera rostochiensis TaxID=31243 RepID=A0A914I765_GLORO